jgi:hypothetical protein
MKEDLAFFSSVHTSRGVYRQPKISLDAFLETGDGVYASVKEIPGKPKKVETLKSTAVVENVCDKSEDVEFIEKLKESLGFIKTGLPPGTTLKLAINYSINLIKPDDGKEELWFQVISYDGQVLQVKLAQTPQKVKYLKEGNAIKPTLDKIEKFYFEE